MTEPFPRALPTRAMQTFFKHLDELRTPASQRDEADLKWVFCPYDQLTDQLGPLASAPPEETGLILIENVWKSSRRPYHKQKLALVLSNMRHFALEQARRGVHVRYETCDGPYRELLESLAEELGTIAVMEPAERELREDLRDLVDRQLMAFAPHEGWLTSTEQFEEACGEPPWRMDSFYRRVRQNTDIMMDDGSPVGGKYSHDGDNREFWPGDPPAPTPLSFPVDPIKREVGELVEDRFADHPGRLDLERLPATAEDAEAQWAWAREHCMACFGPYEDAMSTRSRTIFHTRLSELLNLHRLLPKRVVNDVLELDIPINSKEGFVRQVIGWREFMRHVHSATDGFRELPDRTTEVRDEPGDAGYEAWHDRPWRASEHTGEPPMDGGASPSALDADAALPPAFWGATSGLSCLDHVVTGVLEEGYSHHITRLMVLSNIATLLDVSPRELTDWFWSAYTDAYDWVVEPNVLGMGTFGVGELFTTKPYVSGANYIDKMSDYCDECAFDPGKDCPLREMYWAFLARNEDKLSDNRRMSLMYGNLRRRSDEKKQRDRRVFETVSDTLADGQTVTPTLLANRDEGEA